MTQPPHQAAQANPAAEPNSHATELQLRSSTAQHMTGVEMQKILQLRVTVFVAEQQIICEEIDHLDRAETTQHIWLEANGQVVSVLRLLLDGPVVRIGRVATGAEHRRRGYSQQLMWAALERAEETGRPVEIHAQAYLEDWYAKFGFQRTGPNFLEEGVDHVPMLWAGKPKGTSA
ncbi:GNAT family N-acetyltransferase [Kocuria sp.]|uniref:GNAT family N-acetyltransferase n=1 Tax=Kocuria sp. TaxID=1871328 RepID=UPI0026DEC17B|nr:GNAT family N-acetyltransferase [Kocuria sp.]MDO5618914.1 GNAT family N-acetyltransferase [Kocuria sp.]